MHVATPPKVSIKLNGVHSYGSRLDIRVLMTTGTELRTSLVWGAC